jgi:hypothetical protein
MRRPLRRLHFMVWLVLTPVFLALIAYAVTRTPIDRTETDAPAALFEPQGGR